MKKLIVALGLIACVGVGSGIALNQQRFVPTYAEEETSEVVDSETSEISIEETTSEEIVSGETSIESETKEDSGFFDKLSQGAKDFLIVAKEILNEPIVIGGVSVSLGAIIVFVFTKLFSVLSKKKIKVLGSQVEELFTKMEDSVNKKDYNALANQTKELIEVCKVLANGSRNVKVRENALAILKDFEPVINDNKDFVIAESKKVQEDTTTQIDKTSKDIIDIVNKD